MQWEAFQVYPKEAEAKILCFRYCNQIISTGKAKSEEILLQSAVYVYTILW